MPAALVARILAYCLGKGRLCRRGHNKTVWLEIIRCETEKTYLDHQLRTLRKLSQGQQVRADLDRVDSTGFYDRLRLRFHAPELERAWELLYPDGERRLGLEPLRIAGPLGLASLWIDRGRWEANCGILQGGYTRDDIDALLQWFAELNVPARAQARGVRFGVKGMEQLVKIARPHTHEAMRHRLRRPRVRP